MANILVTGGAGYIGSHTCKLLKLAGHTPITYDNLCRGFKSSVQWGPLVEADLFQLDKLIDTLKSYKIQAVIHFAAYAYVGESTEKPQMYFRNNVLGTVFLLEAMAAANVNKLVFSSSCAVYGAPSEQPIRETTPQKPINPYGLSKKMAEELIQKAAKTSDLNACSLRYFNVGGADPELEIGESHDPEPHIIPNILRKAEKSQVIDIFGKDYPTSDGTCIRDYIHVMDLAQAHLLTINKLLIEEGTQAAYNLGTERGTSLLELINAAERVLEKQINFEFKEKREGDPAELVASSDKFKNDFNWSPNLSDIDTILQTAHLWSKKSN